VEALPFAANARVPVSGLIDATASGSGSFASPQYTVKGTLRDFFVGDEGVGEVFGTLGIDNDLMTVSLDAASPRLAASVTGRVALTPELDAELTVLATDTSLDPYVRLFWPQLSPYTTAIASGNVRIVGPLMDREHLLVDATVERFEARLFDYAIRNAAPIRMGLESDAVRVTDMRLVGQETQLSVDGGVSLADEQIDLRAAGDANLGILQAFLPNVASSGRAALSASFTGPMRAPSVQGTMKIQDGRIRHFSLPHGLENIGGALTFDSRAIRLDQLRGRLATGDVQFGGTIGFDGYQPGRLAVTMAGTNMRLRFPEGMRSLVDATLALDGTPANAVLSGDVTVRDAEYRQAFSTGAALFDLGGSTSLPAPPSQNTLPLRYDIRIDAPSALHVRNNLMTLDASASLQLQGTFDRPLLFGRADVERGLVNFEARRWVVTRGTIDFNNPVRIDPFIDVEAETRVRAPGETYRVTIRATGTRERFSQLTFDSDPVLPQAEVMALVFGDISPARGETAELRRFGDVTPLEALARDRAARELTSVVSSEVDRVAQQTFGVDTFQITPSLNDSTQQSSRFVPGARLTIGKRLSERAYLTYSRSLSSTSRDQIILLEYDQSERFSWILSRNEDGTYAVDFRMRSTF
jgi:translocation and assembly module TamB